MRKILLSFAALMLTVTIPAQASTLDDLQQTLKDINAQNAVNNQRLHDVVQGLSKEDLTKLTATPLTVPNPEKDDNWTVSDGVSSIADLMDMLDTATSYTVYSMNPKK